MLYLITCLLSFDSASCKHRHHHHHRSHAKNCKHSKHNAKPDSKIGGDLSQSEQCDNIISKTNPEDARIDKTINQGNIVGNTNFRISTFRKISPDIRIRNYSY